MKANLLKAISLGWVICLILLTYDLTAQAKDPEILPIRSVPQIQRPAVPGEQMLDFSGGGTIQRIGLDDVGKKIIVIDDRLLYFATGVTYHSKQGDLISELKFKEGNTVGYFLNDKRQITRLYLTE